MLLQGKNSSKQACITLDCINIVQYMAFQGIYCKKADFRSY